MPTQNSAPPTGRCAPRSFPAYAECSRQTTVTVARAKPATILPKDRGLDQPRPSMHDAMLIAVPRLRAYALSLGRSTDRADDLVQETLLRAMAKIESFQPGTNMNAWLFTILRNVFLSECRKRRREVEDPDGTYVASLVSQPVQESRMAIEELRVALDTLPPKQRDALILVGGWGFRQCEAARLCGTKAGTIKSRVHRARMRLSKKLFPDEVGVHASRATCSAPN